MVACQKFRGHFNNTLMCADLNHKALYEMFFLNHGILLL